MALSEPQLGVGSRSLLRLELGHHLHVSSRRMRGWRWSVGLDGGGGTGKIQSSWCPELGGDLCVNSR